MSSSDEDEAAKLLIDRGAKVNATNKKGATPLIIAAVKGHYSVLRILANHPEIKLHEQVSIIIMTHYMYWVAINSVNDFLVLLACS